LDAPAIDTGSVMASTRLSTALWGPTISTIAGSVVTEATTNPSAGWPSTAGKIFTTFDDDRSNLIARPDGVT
jgi:hypothetical protein